MMRSSCATIDEAICKKTIFIGKIKNQFIRRIFITHTDDRLSPRKVRLKRITKINILKFHITFAPLEHFTHCKRQHHHHE